jgi:Protein of unknown function (DUF3429)
MNTNSLKSSFPAAIPRAVTRLGYSGLLPFLILAVASMTDDYHRSLWIEALVAYAAVILSFVGAIHWGFAMALNELSMPKRNECFVWSVIPALIAWVAFLLPTHIAGMLLIAGFLLQYAQDYRLGKVSRLPDWYLSLRLRLTLVACLCLSVLFIK